MLFDKLFLFISPHVLKSFNFIIKSVFSLFIYEYNIFFNVIFLWTWLALYIVNKALFNWENIFLIIEIGIPLLYFSLRRLFKFPSHNSVIIYKLSFVSK